MATVNERTKNWDNLNVSVRPGVRAALRDLANHYGLSNGQVVAKLVGEEVARLGRKGVAFGEGE